MCSRPRQNVKNEPLSRGSRAVTAKKCTKSVMHVQSCCFANLNLLFFFLPFSFSCVGTAHKVSPDWSHKTMTCHSFSCFSIVWVRVRHHWKPYELSCSRGQVSSRGNLVHGAHVFLDQRSWSTWSVSRILLTEVLAFRSTGFIMDTLISTFPKILYTTDVMDALKVGSLWVIL